MEAHQLEAIPPEKQKMYFQQLNNAILEEATNTANKGLVAHVFKVLHLGPSEEEQQELVSGSLDALKITPGLVPVMSLRPQTVDVGRSKVYNAQVADVDSDPPSHARLNEIGELFVNVGTSPPLNCEERHFSQIVCTADDVTQLVDTVVAAVRVVTACQLPTGIQSLLVNPDDIKVCIGSVLQQFLQSQQITSNFVMKRAYPLICLDGGVGWVKYVIMSNGSLLSSCCGQTQKFDLAVKIYSYYFPNFKDLTQQYNMSLERLRLMGRD